MRLKKHISPLLIERNVLNVDEVDAFIDSVSKRHRGSKGKKWLKTVYRKHLINTAYATHVDKDDLKDKDFKKNRWLKKALDSGEDVFLVRNLVLSGDLSHWLDWIEMTDVRDVTRLTVSQVMEAVMRWDEETRKAQKLEQKVGRTDALAKLPGGLTLHRLKDQVALSYEGSHMGHCVAGYSIGDYLEDGDGIFSIRDKQNKPHVTIEAAYGGIVQVKGKENKPPVMKYMPAVTEAITKHLKLDFTKETRQEEGILLASGRTYVSAYDIPKGTKLSDDLTVTAMMTNWTDDFTIPEGVSATLASLRAGGHITIKKGCKFDVVEAGTDVAKLSIEGAEIRALTGEMPSYEKTTIKSSKIHRANITAGSTGITSFEGTDVESCEIRAQSGARTEFDGGQFENVSVSGGEVMFAAQADEITVERNAEWTFVKGADVSILYVSKPSKRPKFKGGSFGYALLTELGSIGNIEISKSADFGHLGFSACDCTGSISVGKVELLEIERDNDSVDLTLTDGSVKELKVDYVPPGGQEVCVTIDGSAKVGKITGRGKDFVRFA